MDADVQRRETLLEDPIPVVVAEVGESDVVSVKKGQAIIVVLDVESGPELLELRVSLYEAKRTGVRAPPDLVRLGYDSERFVDGFLNIENQRLAFRRFRFHQQRTLCLIEQQVQTVSNRILVDRQDSHPDRKIEIGGDRARFDSLNSYHGPAMNACWRNSPARERERVEVHALPSIRPAVVEGALPTCRAADGLRSGALRCRSSCTGSPRSARRT